MSVVRSNEQTARLARGHGCGGSVMRSSPFRLRALAAAGLVAAVALAACSSGSTASNNSKTGTVTVAVGSNPLITSQMVPLTQSVFEKQNPRITVKVATSTEGDRRAA